MTDPPVIELRLRRVESPEAAEPRTLPRLADRPRQWRDVDTGAAERTDFGLKCRIYRSEAGQSPLPPEPWLRAALGVRVEA